MIKEAIGKLTEGQDLTFDEVKTVMNEIMSGETSPVLISSYLTALRMKGETIDEIAGSARGMRDAGIKVNYDQDLLEIVGTGGDKAFTFNISTTSAFVIASTGIKVAKHGNKGVSSKSGAADVLTALGANIDSTPEKAKRLLDECNFAFLFAQKYHSSMKYVGPVRGELGIRTVFNVLGPLTNPAGAALNVIGVYDESLLEPMASVLVNLGTKRGLVVFGQDVMDEISMSAKTSAIEIRDGKVGEKFEINPEDYGFTLCKKSELVGGDAEENAAITRAILSGEKGPKRDAVVMNSAAGIYVASDDISMEEAIKSAEAAIDSGRALETLEKYIALSNE